MTSTVSHLRRLAPTAATLALVPALLTALEHIVFPDGENGAILWRSIIGFVAACFVIAASLIMLVLLQLRLSDRRALSAGTDLRALDRLNQYDAVISLVGKHEPGGRQAPVLAFGKKTGAVPFAWARLVGTAAGMGFIEQVQQSGYFKDVDLAFARIDRQGMPNNEVSATQQVIREVHDEIVRRSGNESLRVLVDYTGGRSTMTAGAVLACEELGLDMVYLDTTSRPHEDILVFTQRNLS